MTLIRNFMLGILVSLTSAAAARAQEERATTRQPGTATAVTISVSSKGLRFVVIGGARQTRLEVFGEGGDSLYNSGFQPGSVRDWSLEDAHGQRLNDGLYLCLIAVRDFSGSVSVKQGSIVVQGGQASLQMKEAEQVAPTAPDKSLTPVTDDPAAALTLTAHDGRDGQVVSTRGGLSFRAGDFFAGRDRELMRLTPDGDLGVGVAAPQAKLDVAGTIRARGGIQFDDGSLLTSAGLRSNSAPGVDASATNGVTTNAVAGTGTVNKLPKWLDGNGTLGDSAILEAGGLTVFGRPTPLLPDAANFHLVEMVAPGTKTPLVLVGGSGSMEFWKDTNAAGGGPTAAMAFGMAVPGTAATSDVVFSTYGFGGGSWTERLRLTQGGNLGLGVSAPTAKLHVAGDIKVMGSAFVDGNIAAKYQDVAEWVPARQQMAVGTVVILDVTRTNTVRASARTYDIHVAGVVTAQPGVILGQGGEGKIMVATTGRVKVRVDATRRPIRVGDLLVTSGKSGLAMRSRPVRVSGVAMHRPGTIIGKALEPLARGRGEILVLLSLQ